MAIDESSITIEGYNYDDYDDLPELDVLHQATAACLTEGATVSFSWSYTTDDGPFYDPAFYVNGLAVSNLTDIDGP